MLQHIHERLPITRLVQKTITLPASSTDAPVDVAPLFHICSVVVKSAPADATMKFGGTMEGSIPIVAGETRSDLAINSLFLSSVTGGSVVLEVHGR